MAPFVIAPPENLGDKDLNNFFRGWEWKPAQAVGRDVLLDLEHCQFLAPWALVLFSTYLLKLQEVDSVRVDISASNSTRAGEYATSVGLHELFGLARPSGFKPPEDARTTPLSRIRSAGDIPSVAASVLGVLRIDDEEMRGAVQYSLIELLRNVVQHSQSPVGGVVMAQHFPNSGLVEVAVADLGIGVRGALLKQYEHVVDDLDALKLALLPHVSGTFGAAGYSSMSENAGLGLFFAKEIASRGLGGLFLGSGRALIDVWGKEGGDEGKLYIRSRQTGWPGTFAVLQFRSGGIVDFDSLLELCRDLAASSREQPGRIPLRFLSELPCGSTACVVRVKEFCEDVEAAARVRDVEVAPRLLEGADVILDFEGVSVATQSFAHACLYKVLRDIDQVYEHLSIARATNGTRQAILAVAAYARQK